MTTLLRFFDHTLRGADNGWEKTPRVRYAVLDLEGGDRINQPAAEFPPTDFSTRKYYLDATSHALSPEAPAEAAMAGYDAQSEQGQMAFTVQVDAPTEFVGYPKLRLWLEADGSDDMDVFVFLQKLNVAGEQLEQFNVPNTGPKIAGADAAGRGNSEIQGFQRPFAGVHAAPRRNGVNPMRCQCTASTASRNSRLEKSCVRILIYFQSDLHCIRESICG